MRPFGLALVVAGLALAAGCGPADNSKVQTPNDQPIGAPTQGPADKGARGNQAPLGKQNVPPPQQ